MEPKLPSPLLFLDTLIGYQKTAMIRAALELDVFTAIGDGASSVEELAATRALAPRGARILCDSLTIAGFLTKEDGRYRLTADSATFLNRHSPTYFGGVMQFMLSETIEQSFDRLTDSVRLGRTALDTGGTMAPDHPVWVQFAQAMAPLAGPLARTLAERLDLRGCVNPRVLDIAAGHGLYGLAFAQRYSEAIVTALDWEAVLEVTAQNARRVGCADRLCLLPGSAFDVDLGGEYDVVLVPNFLHHFGRERCVGLLKRFEAALAPGGCVAAVEFVTHDDRITPPNAASFAMVMLASTTDGDAYTWSEYRSMFEEAGLSQVEWLELPPSAETAVIGRKAIS
jgi:2-polyprenyl-3-methyl-5-hydroxy-6-metoxy-1,4-benzoquinol methylase